MSLDYFVSSFVCISLSESVFFYSLSFVAVILCVILYILLCYFISIFVPARNGVIVFLFVPPFACLGNLTVCVTGSVCLSADPSVCFFRVVFGMFFAASAAAVAADYQRKQVLLLLRLAIYITR